MTRQLVRLPWLSFGQNIKMAKLAYADRDGAATGFQARFLMTGLLMLLPLAQISSAQPQLLSPEQRLKLFQRSLDRRATAITENSMSGLRTLEEWKQRRPEIKQQVQYMLGLDLWPS